MYCKHAEGTDIKINTKLLPHPPCHLPFSQEPVRCCSFPERVKQLCKAHLTSPVCTWCAETTPALSSAVLGEEPQEWLSTPVFAAFFVNKTKGDFGLCVQHGLCRAGQGKLLLTKSIVENGTATHNIISPGTWVWRMLSLLTVIAISVLFFNL